MFDLRYLHTVMRYKNGQTVAVDGAIGFVKDSHVMGMERVYTIKFLSEAGECDLELDILESGITAVKVKK